MSRQPTIRSSRFRRLMARTAAGVAIGAVVATGSIALEPPEPAQAAWQGDLQEWLGGLNASLGTAGELFSVETGPFNIAMSLAGPLISAIFGTGGGPGIEDVLDKLQELDDIENKLDVMQSELVEINKNVIDVKIDVVMGTCTLQTDALPDLITHLKTSQDDYSEVLAEIEAVRSGKTDHQADLQDAITAFVDSTMGSPTQFDTVSSTMGQSIRNAHEHLVTTNGRIGAIQSCGSAYYQQWQVAQTSAAARAGTTESDRGIWLDDRQYYEPLQQMVRYWQTAEAQGMFLLQQASLMQAALQYTQADHLTLAPENAASVCREAIEKKAGHARFVCTSALNFSNSVHDMIVDEWKQVGLPISNDQVVMSLGTDVTGVADGGARTDSLVWARTPNTFAAPWVKGTWDDKVAPVTVDGVAGFAPATSAQWSTLQSQYVTSHTSVKPFVQSPVQQLGGSADATWGTAGVASFAPFDLLTLMRESRIPGSDAHGFDTTGVDMVWIPNETATRDMPNWRFVSTDHGKAFGSADKLTFAPSAATGWRDDNADFYWETDTGMSVKCMVAPVDGLLCGGETIASWFIARQKADWSRNGATFTVTPSSGVLDRFAATTTRSVRCQSWRSAPSIYPTGCEWQLDGGLTEVPAWLAPFDLKDGQSYIGRPTQQTLWPVAALPAECGKTNWGAPTRCGASMDAWLKANIPNPKVPGPQPANTYTITPGAGSGTCTAPAWAANASEAGVPVETSDVTWVAWAANGTSVTMTSPLGREISLTVDLAQKAGWWTEEEGATVSTFFVRCSVDARYSDLATVTTVTSAVGTARYGTLYYDLVTRVDDPSPDPASPSAAGGGSATTADGRVTLAATGGTLAGWPAFAAVMMLAGAALALAARGRSRSRTSR